MLAILVSVQWKIAVKLTIPTVEALEDSYSVAVEATSTSDTKPPTSHKVPKVLSSPRNLALARLNRELKSGFKM